MPETTTPFEDLPILAELRDDLSRGCIRARRRTVRRRAVTSSLGMAAVVATGLVVALGAAGGGGASGGADGGAAAGGGAAGTGGATATGDSGAAHLQLASYRFSLPEDASVVAATPSACALRPMVVYPHAPNPDPTSPPEPGPAPDQPGIGMSAANQPTIANAVTAQGGCVSMALTDPYTPGSDLTPLPGFATPDQSPITIDGSSGTIGMEELIGAGPTGQSIPPEKNVLLTLVLPAPNGQKQLFLAAAAGVSEEQLESIVTSGLDQTGASAQSRRS